MSLAEPEHRLDGQSRELFATTQWGVVLEAGQERSPRAAEALEKLCQVYWYPLYAHVRRRGYSVEDAKDLTQGFFAEMLERHWIASASPERGRFRSYLLKALEHFLINDWQRAHAAKRGGWRTVVSINETLAERRYRLEPATDWTPERSYEQHWACTVLDQALGRLREERAGNGKEREFNRLKEYLSKDLSEASHAAVAAELGTTPDAVGVAICRLRQRYRELVREELAHTVGSSAEVDDELRWLLSVLS